MSPKRAPSSLVSRAWSEPKPGNAPDENEDAFAIRVLGSRDGRTLLALADGASTTIYARAWAQALVTSAEPEWLTLKDDELSARLDDVRDGFDVAGTTPVPWYVQRKTDQDGSQAALLVVLLDPSGNDSGTEIRAVAVGDCNVLILRRDGTTASFPVKSSSGFTSVSELVGSRPQGDLHYHRWMTRVGPDDLVLACTDAVGEWMLACVEANRKDAVFQVVRDLAKANSSELSESGQVIDGVGLLRATLTRNAFQHPLREDDLTLVLCQPETTKAQELIPRLSEATEYGIEMLRSLPWGGRRAADLLSRIGRRARRGR